MAGPQKVLMVFKGFSAPLCKDNTSTPVPIRALQMKKRTNPPPGRSIVRQSKRNGNQQHWWLDTDMKKTAPNEHLAFVKGTDVTKGAKACSRAVFSRAKGRLSSSEALKTVV